MEGDGDQIGRLVSKWNEWGEYGRIWDMGYGNGRWEWMSIRQCYGEGKE